jgi:hypothetical protein
VNDLPAMTKGVSVILTTADEGDQLQDIAVFEGSCRPIDHKGQ